MCFSMPLSHSASKPVRFDTWRRFRDALARGLNNAVEEWIVKRAIAELHGLDDHMLRDIGITRSEIESRIRHGKQKRPYY
jgi:uncharacterized protein YjiS (DUF1127 family)